MSEDAFEGLRSVFSSLSSDVNKTYTRQDFERDLDAMFATLSSDEYAQQEQARYIAMAQGEEFIGKALAQGIISDAEFWRLYESIGINGALIVSPSMSQRLAKVIV